MKSQIDIMIETERIMLALLKWLKCCRMVVLFKWKEMLYICCVESKKGFLWKEFDRAKKINNKDGACQCVAWKKSQCVREKKKCLKLNIAWKERKVVSWNWWNEQHGF